MNPASVSAIVATATFAFAAIGWMSRWAWRILRRMSRFLDDFFGEPAHDGVPARPGVMFRIGEVEKGMNTIKTEVMPNTGHSLRDVIHRTSTDVEDLKRNMSSLTRKVDAMRTGDNNGN